MSPEEALAWLRGERSEWNTFVDLTEDRAVNLAMCRVADAASTWQALAVATAHEALSSRKNGEDDSYEFGR